MYSYIRRCMSASANRYDISSAFMCEQVQVGCVYYESCECSMCDCVHTHPQRKFCVACTYLLHSRQTCLMFQSPPTTFPYHSQDIPQMLIQSSRSVSTHPQNMFCVMCVFVHFITVARQTNAVKMICPQRRENTSCWTPHWLNEKSVIIHKLTPFALAPV